MSWLEFGILLNNNIILYLIITLISIVLYFFIYKNIYLSILDPVIFNTLYSVFGFTIVWFLYLTLNIDLKYLISYLITQLAFWFGLFFFRSLNKDSILSINKVIFFRREPFFIKTLFFVTTIVYISIQLLSYIKVGIPLLKGSHVDIYNGSAGWGILGHFIDVLKPASIFLLIYYLFQSKSSLFFSIYKFFFLLLLLIFFTLSGSRSDFMTLGFVLFCFLILNAKEIKQPFSKIRNYEKIILIAGICFVFLTIVIQASKNGDESSSITVFLFRLVSSGDTYYFSYPYRNIETLKGDHAFLALFGDIFGTLRIIPRNNLPVVLGLQLYRLFYESDVVVGPNARHNVFGYVYFGFYGSIVFSFILGLTLSYLRNKLFFTFRKNTIGQLLFVLLYLDIAFFETDPPVSISSIENAFIVLPPIILIAVFFSMALNKCKIITLV